MRRLTILIDLALTCGFVAAGCSGDANGDTPTTPTGDSGAGATDPIAPPGQGGQGGQGAQGGPSEDAQPRLRAADSPPLGLTWSVATSGTTQGLHVVIWVGDRFVAVGDGGTVLQAPDGISWSALDSGITDDLRSLTWTGKLLVAVAANGKVFTSASGTAWTEQGIDLDQQVRQVAWTGKVLSAVGVDGYTAVSSDGITWTSRQNMDLATFVPTSAVWTGSTLVWGGYSNLTEVNFNEGMAFSTRDGVTFANLSPGYQCNSLFGVAWNGAEPISGLTTEYNGELIAAGRNGEMFTMSYGMWDSGKWGEGYTSTMDVNAVIWTGAEAVAVGEGSVVLRSTTGHYRSWTQVDIPTGGNFTSLAWNEDRLVAVDSAGTILTSP